MQDDTNRDSEPNGERVQRTGERCDAGARRPQFENPNSNVGIDQGRVQRPSEETFRKQGYEESDQNSTGSAHRPSTQSTGTNSDADDHQSEVEHGITNGLRYGSAHRPSIQRQDSRV